MIPDEFFDDEVEKEKEFLDMASSIISKDGLKGLVTNKNEAYTWEEFETDDYVPAHIKAAKESSKSSVGRQDKEMEEGEELSSAESFGLQSFFQEDLNEIPIDESTILTPEMYNYTLPWRHEDEIPDEILEKFVPNTSRELFKYDKQVCNFSVFLSLLYSHFINNVNFLG